MLHTKIKQREFAKKNPEKSCQNDIEEFDFDLSRQRLIIPNTQTAYDYPEHAKH